MSYRYPFSEYISLFVEGRIEKKDAKRQEKTAREILSRLEKQPGVILADEVGMGKTFVALAVAVSIILNDERERPVVVMVPPSLMEKWPIDFELFREKCLTDDFKREIKYATASRSVEFLKLLDDPPERKKSLIFLKHGAMSRTLNDGWVKLVVIQRALKWRRNIEGIKRALYRFSGELLNMRWVDMRSREVWEELLSSNPAKWLKVLHKHGIDPEHDRNPETDDDPIPEAVLKVLDDLKTDDVFEVLKSIPRRRSKKFKKHIRNTRIQINRTIRILWDETINSMNLDLPLLIFDEAHHLKNPNTIVSSLFQIPDAKKDADEVTRGPLGNVFERMLFLTATPFQLGHHELCSVLDRFDSIRWKTHNSPEMSRKEFSEVRKQLLKKLDKAQRSAVSLDKSWGRLNRDDYITEEIEKVDKLQELEEFIENNESVSHSLKEVRKRIKSTKEKMKEAERVLRQWIIRHKKANTFDDSCIKRRDRVYGDGIINDVEDTNKGIKIEGDTLLPFLLAALATARMPNTRPVFSEGLASSYEAFMHTRQQKETTDSDDDNTGEVYEDNVSQWYLDNLQNILPVSSKEKAVKHPKLNATVEKVINLWEKGEKVLVFCHYIATGRALRQYISDRIMERIREEAAKMLKCNIREVDNELEKIRNRFKDAKSPTYRTCREIVRNLLGDYSILKEFEEELIRTVSLYIRTPTFLVRYFPLSKDKFSEEDLEIALKKKDESGLSLENLLKNFFDFLSNRCGEKERKKYIDALTGIQTGTHVGADVTKTFGEDEIQGDRSERLVANVRLANGQVRRDTRQKLMLTFNTPFYPEILVASSVMAEGVDLHLNCRYVIHHDLCWNPSTLEQRTGRIDRIGSKAEHCKKSVKVFIPYIAQTQDEKMFRVVMDRERWFNIVMGGKFETDTKTTEKLSERIPIPEEVAEELSFNLDI